MKKLLVSSDNTRQSTLIHQLPDLHPTTLYPVHPHLPADGRPKEDALLADYNDIDFPAKYNYQSVECLQFYISKKNCRGAVVK